jgi:high-affinity iron transporter
MESAAFIVWRESVEALLVVGILYAFLSRSGWRAGLRWLWSGVGVGLVLAGLLAAAITLAQSELAGLALDWFNTAIVLLAAVLIVQMVVWMRRHGASLKRELETGAAQAASTADGLGMATLAALAVAREGAETVVFLQGVAAAGSSNMLVGSGLGLLLALATFWLLSRGSRWLSWRVFFKVGEVLLLLLACALLTDGVDRMIGMEALPTLVDPAWDASWLLDDMRGPGALAAAFAGWRARPAGTVVIVWAVFWTLAVWIMLRPRKPMAAKS